ncbi:hypothetical protein HGRIS_002718 [Hohenbuehelia grisea]|uniref:PHD-type domain-containing protein n=1 Tax=Hohenbuehelia grisea TaxID=104357 RepID=A0ABR3JM91_9AGAR
MAQPATMGPPLSPREPRRSGRRSAPSASASTSKSPDSDAPPPRTKEPSQRPPLPSTSSGAKSKRPKVEDGDDPVEDARTVNGSANGTPSTSTQGNGGSNGRAKRKPKEKDKQSSVADSVSEPISRKSKQVVVEVEEVPVDPQDDEAEGITRCVCGSAEDDPDAGEFMVQCETCKVWQHGLCMGYESEDQLHDDDYYCELCRPELHAELLKKLAKRPRQSSNHNSAVSHSRTSRSHSPSFLMKQQQPSKRRNTMNSNFDESIKEVMEASAAEAAAYDSKPATWNGHPNGHVEYDEDADTGVSRKKRKRTDDDANTKKRTRSASTVSDQPPPTSLPRDATPGASSSAKPPPPPPIAPPPKAPGRQRRGGGRKAAVRETPVDGEDSTLSASNKRQATNTRARTGNATRRPPASQHAAGNEIGRRNLSSGATAANPSQMSSENSRAYRNSHAYVVSQQTLFTSWNLPDYLAHLEHILPTDTPRPLEVRAGPSNAGAAFGRGESMERTMERGVKVKWPSKRMSVGDMNKRVRALVEWVGREQATAMDRSRRRDALMKSLKDSSSILEVPDKDKSAANEDMGASLSASKDVPMAVDDEPSTESTEPLAPAHEPPDKTNADSSTIAALKSLSAAESAAEAASSTMKMMEELMEELIGFQERFGPGAKTRERERKVTA